MNGTMIWFHEARGSGFLLSDDGTRLPVDREAFVDGTAPVGRCSGLAVTFTIGEREGEPIALDVSFVEALNPRRARRRGSGMRGGS